MKPPGSRVVHNPKITVQTHRHNSKTLVIHETDEMLSKFLPWANPAREPLSTERTPWLTCPPTCRNSVGVTGERVADKRAFLQILHSSPPISATAVHTVSAHGRAADVGSQPSSASYCRPDQSRTANTYQTAESGLSGATSWSGNRDCTEAHGSEFRAMLDRSARCQGAARERVETWRWMARSIGL